MPTTLRDEALKLLDGRGAILDAAREISAAMREHGVEGAIVGGVAVVLHGHIRTTVDIDVSSPEPAGRLVGVLESLGFVLHRLRREFMRDEIVVHIVRPEQVPTPPREVVEIEDVRTVSLADLIAMKLRSGLARMTRVQDLADVIGLIRKRGLTTDSARRSDAPIHASSSELVRAVAE